jgi:hypothetical protein
MCVRSAPEAIIRQSTVPTQQVMLQRRAEEARQTEQLRLPVV